MLNSKLKHKKRREMLLVAAIWFFAIACGFAYAQGDGEAPFFPGPGPGLEQGKMAQNFHVVFVRISRTGAGAAGGNGTILTMLIKLNTIGVRDARQRIGEGNISKAKQDRSMLPGNSAVVNGDGKIAKKAGNAAMKKAAYKRGLIKKGYDQIGNCSTRTCVAVAVASKRICKGSNFTQQSCPQIAELDLPFFSKAYAAISAKNTHFMGATGPGGGPSKFVPTVEGCDSTQGDAQKNMFCADMHAMFTKQAAAYVPPPDCSSMDQSKCAEQTLANWNAIANSPGADFVDKALVPRGGPSGSNDDPHFFVSSAYAQGGGGPDAAGQDYQTAMGELYDAVSETYPEIQIAALSGDQADDIHKLINAQCFGGGSLNKKAETGAIKKGDMNNITTGNGACTSGSGSSGSGTGAGSGPGGATRVVELSSEPKYMVSGLSLKDLFGPLDPQEHLHGPLVASVRLKDFYGKGLREPQPIQGVSMLVAQADAQHGNRPY